MEALPPLPPLKSRHCYGEAGSLHGEILWREAACFSLHIAQPCRLGARWVKWMSASQLTTFPFTYSILFYDDRDRTREIRGRRRLHLIFQRTSRSTISSMISKRFVQLNLGIVN